MKDQEIIESIEKLKIEPGDLVVINLSIRVNQEISERLSNIFAGRFLPAGAKVVVCDESTRIEVIKNNGIT